MFLERMGGLPFDDSIRVPTRNKMPPTAMLAVDNVFSASRSRRYSRPAVPELVDSTYASDNRSPEWAPSAYSHAQPSSGSIRPV
jgi:hypothetical protein